MLSTEYSVILIYIHHLFLNQTFIRKDSSHPGRTHSSVWGRGKTDILVKMTIPCDKYCENINPSLQVEKVNLTQLFNREEGEEEPEETCPRRLRMLIEIRLGIWGSESLLHSL